MTSPFDGIRVIDFSRVLSGPSCAKALLDLGAEVIKVEPPEGDLTRTAQPRVAGIPVYFAQQNCGKRCISIDLRTDKGSRLALQLIERSDVVVENFRPGVMDRLGLGYQAVRERNPQVVYCSITGYGQDGPAAGRRAYAPVIHAEVGLTDLVSRRLGVDPRAEPVSYVDFYSGLQAALAVSAALYQRARSGRGQHIDVCMAEVMLQATEWTAVELAGGEGGRFHVFGGANAPVVHLADGTVVCVAGDPVSTFPAWCEAMGKPELLGDDRFATHTSRNDNRAAMQAEIESFAASIASFGDFEEIVGRSRLAAGRVASVAEAVEQPWAAARGAIVDVPADDERARLPRSPFRFSDAESGTRGRPATQGEHNSEVLGELLGLDAAAVAALEEEGVLVRRPPPDRR